MSEANVCATRHSGESGSAHRRGGGANRRQCPVSALLRTAGLLDSARSASGQRHYSTDVAERVGFIQRIFAAGLSSRTMAELLPFIDAPTAENYDFALERMICERDRLNGHIADHIRTRDSLYELMAINRAHRKRRWPES